MYARQYSIRKKALGQKGHFNYNWVLTVGVSGLLGTIFGLSNTSVKFNPTAYARSTQGARSQYTLGIGNEKRLIDFSTEINGFAASRAGIIISSTKGGQSSIVFGPSSGEPGQNSGLQDSNNQWPVLNTGGNNTTGSVDYKKLYHAIGVAEGCSTPWHQSVHNCVSMGWWEKRKGKPDKFHMYSYASWNDNFVAFKNLWVRAYSGALPTMHDAAKWTGNDKAYGWRNTVLQSYYSQN